MRRRTTRLAAAASCLLATLLVVLVPAPVFAQFAPPFSREIQSTFLNQTLHTCTLGNFEPGSFSGESAPHHWWIKAPGPNTLDIHVAAFSVNTTEESGSILATLYTPEGQLLDFVQVFHPTGPDFSPGASATATLSVPIPDAGSALFRLDVSNGPPVVSGTGPAHHYRLGFDMGDAPDSIMLGLDSGDVPDSFKYFEPGLQVFYANVDQGENFQLTVVNDEHTSGTVEIRSKDRLDVGDGTDDILGIGTWTDDELTHTFAVDNVAAGTLFIAIEATGHYSLVKPGGADRGLYMDDCPPRPYLYSFGGFLAPLASSKVFKQGSTIPVKFQLFDLGAVVSTAVATIEVVQLSDGIPEGDPVDIAGPANEGNTFRYDAGSQQYIFNLGTQNLAAGTWSLIVRLDDGTIRFRDVAVK